MRENEEIRSLSPLSVKLVYGLMWCILPVEMAYIMLLRYMSKIFKIEISKSNFMPSP